MNKYLEAKQRYQEQFNNFPLFFAFSENQFKDGIKKLGLDPDRDRDAVVYIGAGGYIKAGDQERYKAMATERVKQHETALNDVEYVKDMFDYELRNHEYGYTLEPDDAIAACGLTLDKIAKNPVLKHAFEEACKKIRKEEGYE